ncbi:MFS general substrate transporter [Panus rudis PR-1116 ss-1]|nr:MFS general substrate transporter [Panus rudis PR-1116 ss-1]
MTSEKDRASSTKSSEQEHALPTSILEKHPESVVDLVEDASSRNVQERRVMNKIDLRLVPVLCGLYLLAFLDRVNIGNAALFSLKQDLKLGGNEYNSALVIFFVPYVVFEVPSNMLLKKFKPHVWPHAQFDLPSVPICLFGFGLVTTLQGFTQNYSGILATRFFLGLFESGMLPGCYYLISMWYKRSEAQTRYTFLFSACSLAGAFGGLLASAIGKLDGVRGYHGWRWVFILEGLLTCVSAVAFYFLISDFPEEVTWLSAEEKLFVQERLKQDSGRSGIDEKLTVRHVWKVLRDYKTLLGGFMYFGLIVPAYSLVYFAPTIIQGLGNSTPIHTQLLSVPAFAVAFAFSMFIAAISDRLAHRFSFILLSVCISLAGFGILFSVHDRPKLQYGALFLAATGTYCAMPMVCCWVAMNEPWELTQVTLSVRGHANRAIATAWQIGFGNVGGIIASYSFLAKDAPNYLPGYSICISFVCLSTLASCLYLLGVTIENSRLGLRVDNRSTAEEGMSGNAADDGSFAEIPYEALDLASYVPFFAERPGLRTTCVYYYETEQEAYGLSTTLPWKVSDSRNRRIHRALRMKHPSTIAEAQMEIMVIASSKMLQHDYNDLPEEYGSLYPWRQSQVNIISLMPSMPVPYCLWNAQKIHASLLEWRFYEMGYTSRKQKVTLPSELWCLIFDNVDVESILASRQQIFYQFSLCYSLLNKELSLSDIFTNLKS